MTYVGLGRSAGSRLALASSAAVVTEILHGNRWQRSQLPAHFPLQRCAHAPIWEVWKEAGQRRRAHPRLGLILESPERNAKEATKNVKKEKKEKKTGFKGKRNTEVHCSPSKNIDQLSVRLFLCIKQLDAFRLNQTKIQSFFSLELNSKLFFMIAAKVFSSSRGSYISIDFF